MKTPHIRTSSNNLLGGMLLLSLLSTTLATCYFPAWNDLYTAVESQWLNFSNSLSGFMSQPHPRPW